MTNPRRIFTGRIITLDLEEILLPNGRRAELEIVRHPGGAAVVALDAQGRVCLLRQYRHAAGGWLWELPAGKLDPGENPEQTASRELLEEAGVSASQWSSLGSLISSPGVFTEVIHLYLARGELSASAWRHEPDESIEVHWIPLSQALIWAMDGTIRDAKTLVGLFRARFMLAADMSLAPNSSASHQAG